MIYIAFVIDTIASPSAGTEKQLLLLIRHLDRSRFTPYLCVLHSSPWLTDDFNDCELFSADITSFKCWKGLYGIVRLRNFFRAKKIDIVQVHFRDSSLAGIIAARLAGVRRVVATRRNQGYWMNSHELLLQKFLNRWVTAFVANSQATKDWAVENEGLLPEKVYVIYNTLELAPFLAIDAGEGAKVKNELAIPPSSLVVGIVANLRSVKGHEVFLQAASRVCRQGKDVFFLVIGQGKERQRLEGLAKELGILDRLRFVGSQQNVLPFLAALDVGVLSSHSESFSNAIIEYLAAGIPVVCTDVGGVREVVEEDVNGHIVVPGDSVAMGDALVKILSNPDGYSLSGARNWLRDNCSVASAVGSQMRLYDKIYDSNYH